MNFENMSAFEALSSPSSLLSTLTSDPSINLQDPFGFLQEARAKDWPVAWAPNNTAVRVIMQKLAKRYENDSHKISVDGHGFSTEEEMVDSIMANYNNNTKTDFLAGIVFTNDFPEDGSFPKDIHVSENFLTDELTQRQLIIFFFNDLLIELRVLSNKKNVVQDSHERNSSCQE